MIARRIHMNDVSKSRCTYLIQYLIDTQGHESRVQDVRITNCDSEEPEWAAIEMLATQRQNTTARGDKTYHLVLSFHEYPNADTLKAIEDTLCSALGFEGHQRLSVLHGDTDNLHLHVVINKIHPEKLTIHEPYYDHKTLASQCVRLEHAFNLVPDNHQPKAQAVETAAVNMEKAGDMESLIGWIQRTCLAGLKTASSWAQLHEILDQHGLKIKERGNGFTLSSETLHVKPSSVDRGLSKAALEKRLGAFQAAPCQDSARTQPLRTSSDEPIRKSYTSQPLRHEHFDPSRLWEQYASALKRSDQTREKALREARTRRDAGLQQAAKVASIRNFVIQYMVSGAVLKRIMHWQNRSNMRKKQAEIRKKYLEERGQTYTTHPRDTWNAWLVKQAENGNAESLAALRARNPVQPTGNHIAGVRRTDTAPASALPMEKVTRKGAQLFAGGVRDTGNALLFTNMKPETLKNGLELAHERFRVLKVEGDEVFRKNVAQSAKGMPVTFSDPVLEHIRREQLVSVQQRQSRETSRGR